MRRGPPTEVLREGRHSQLSAVLGLLVVPHSKQLVDWMAVLPQGSLQQSW